MVHRSVPVCVGLVLVLSGCGSGSGEALRPAAAEQASAAPVAADLRPVLAEQSELAALVLAAGPDAATAEVVSGVVRDSRALLAEADAALAGAASAPAETAALTEQELAAVRGAVGDEAVRLGLDGLTRSQLTAVSRAKAAVVDGAGGADRALADRVLALQGASLQALAALG